MKIFYEGLFLLTAALLAGCQPGTQEVDALKSEVIKTHDRVMPRNAELIETKADLSNVIAKLDSLKQANPEADTALIHHRVDSLIAALDSADHAMSDWMHEFEVDYSGMEHQQVMDYLKEEKTRITRIEQAYEKSIGGARALLDSIDKK